ncbi:MAG: hypothetical protein NUV59_03075 [Patescibacteria group bacterium]|nr:hypothetical protein [Patescibacteria group bacterium]
MSATEHLHVLLRELEREVNADKKLAVHTNNRFNKQFSVLLRDWNYLKIIVERLESGDPENATQLALDLKSLYVFGRVFSESVLYICSLFVDDSIKIKWDKIGDFVVGMEKDFNAQGEKTKNFWTSIGGSIKILNKAFRYRNEVLHGKESSTEWTFAWPGRSNLDHVFIQNVPWPEDKGKKKEQRSLNAKMLIQILENEIPKIFNYLKMIKNSS